MSAPVTEVKSEPAPIPVKPQPQPEKTLVEVTKIEPKPQNPLLAKLKRPAPDLSEVKDPVGDIDGYIEKA